MKALRSSGLIAIPLLLTVLLAACGSASTPGTAMNTPNQGMYKSTPNTMNSGGMMTATPMASATMGTNNNHMMGVMGIPPIVGGNTAAFIHTGIATINGKQVKVLMTKKGFAIYYSKSDAMFTATCTGACAQAWPPVLAPQGMMTVSSSISLPKHLSVRQTPNGAQVFYDGHALYTYASDMQPGLATGRAVGMVWYLAGFLL